MAINRQIVVAGNIEEKITSWKLDSKALNHTFISKYYVPFSRKSSNHDSQAGIIYSLIFSNDEKTLFSGSADRLIRIWNTTTGQLKSTLIGHTDSILTLAITSSDRFLISGSADKTIRIWDLTFPCSKPHILTGHTNWVTTVAITSDEKYLISGSTDSTIKLWDLETQKIVYTLTDHSDAVWSIAISPDGKTIASASLDKTVKLWDLITGKLLQTLQASSPVGFSDNGKYLITGNSQNQLEIWQRLSENNQLINDPTIAKQWWIVLGVERDATITEIKTAYYHLARKNHPDINTANGSQQMMQIINQAYHQSKIEFKLASDGT